MDKHKTQESEVQLITENPEFLEDLDSISEGGIPIDELHPDAMYWFNNRMANAIYDNFYSRLKKCPFMPNFFQLGVDRFDCIVPDTPELELAFGRSSNEIEGVHPVMVRSSWISDLQNQLLLDCQITPCYYNEKMLGVDHILALYQSYPDMQAVIEFDYGYFSFELMDALYSNEFKRFIFRLNENQLKEIPVQLNPGEDKIVKFQLTREQTREFQYDREFRHHLLSTTYKIRFAKPIVGVNPDGSPKYLAIATDIFPEEVSLDQLVDAYKDRWTAETNYDYLKNDLIIDQFSDQTLEGIQREIYASCRLFNIIIGVAIEKRKKIKKAVQTSKKLNHQSQNQEILEKDQQEAKLKYSATFREYKDELLDISREENLSLRPRLTNILMSKVNRELVPMIRQRFYK